MTSNGQFTDTDTLLFVAETFFLPPKQPHDVTQPPVLPSPSLRMRTMNKFIREDHPWIALNRSLSSLCTLKAAANNVFAVMLLPSLKPTVGKGAGESVPVAQRATPTSVDKVTFLCADNWGDPQDALRPYVQICLTKLLEEARQEVEMAETEGRPVDHAKLQSFIDHVYGRGWPKFCERMKKNNDRGRRLLHQLQRIERSDEPDKPSSLGSLIAAMSRVLNAIQSSVKPRYVDIHNACAKVYEAAFENSEMSECLSKMDEIQAQGKLFE